MRGRSRRRSPNALAGAPARRRSSSFRGRGPDLLGFTRADRFARGRRGGHRARSRSARRRGRTRSAMRRLRPGDEVLLARFLIDRDVYQAPSRSFNVVTMRSMQEWLGRPRLSWYYIVSADPEAMAPLMEYVYFERAAEADFEVGGRSYGVFARDWRRGGGVEWLERMAGRELGDDAAVPDAERGDGAGAGALAGGVRRRRAPRAARPASPGRAGRKSARAHARRARDVTRSCPRPRRCARWSTRRSTRCARIRATSKLVRALDRTYLRPGADAGGRRRAARAALQHLPRAPDARHRAGRGLALAARALRRRRVRRAATRPS